jgi:hypothetical protein
MRFLICALALVATPALAQQGGGIDLGVNKLFTEADTNNDGVVTRAEFLAKAEQQFNAGDSNHDGKITREEAQTQQQQMLNRFLNKGNLNEKLNQFLGGGEPVAAPVAPVVSSPSAPTKPTAQ